ncbi:hypothetical protein Tdes44962_MAKER08969 [Teratosphaeria destructans]|uniref:Uncharacterized protein n=1 Tax=Teratosphaeria destructans TaxID=418781 RepID=A0A9W7SUC6_9PEZI|nr:hypothetical protein Tdes44962_MAKER08969 [Teratosphaeria destructans]
MANSTAAFRNGASMVYSASKQCITSAVAYAGEHILHMVGVCWFGLVSLRDLAKNLLRSLRTSERGTGTTTDAARQPSEAQKSGGETGHTSSHKAKKTRQLDGVLVGGSARQKAKKKEPGFVWI